MDFSTAYYKMLNGAKIKMPSWGGYWAWENNTIMMHCKNGDILDIRCTGNVAYTFGFIASNEWVVMDDEDKFTTTKPKFYLKDYEGKYAMHCDTEQKADIFCNFLHREGKKWNSGASYLDVHHWRCHEEQTAYAFNIGEFARDFFYKGEGYTILEFDDFDWS